MIEFRQKLFAGPAISAGAKILPKVGKLFKGGNLLNGVFAVGTVAQIPQGAKANKIAAQANQVAAKQGAQQLRQSAIAEQQALRETHRHNMRMEQAAFKQARVGTFNTFTGGVAPMGMGGGMMMQTKPMSLAAEKEPETRTFANAKIFKPLEKVAGKIFDSKLATRLKGTQTVTNARGFVKDLGAAAKERNLGGRALNMAASGAVIAGVGYVADRAIQANANKSGMPIDYEGIRSREKEEKSKKSGLKKALGIGAGTVGTIGTALVLARKGKLNANTFKNAGKKVGRAMKGQFWKNPATKTELKLAREEGLKDIERGIEKELRKGRLTQSGVAEYRAKQMKDLSAKLAKQKAGGGVNWGNIGMNVASGAAIPTVGYISQKKQLKNQVSQQEESGQKQYSAVGRAVGRGLEWLSFGAGREGQKSLGKALKNTKSKNPWTKKAINFLESDKHKALKIGGGLVAGSTIMFAPWTISENATKKAISTVDKKAYAYEKASSMPVSTGE